jgi:hypothetical protein
MVPWITNIKGDGVILPEKSKKEKAVPHFQTLPREPKKMKKTTSRASQTRPNFAS